MRALKEGFLHVGEEVESEARRQDAAGFACNQAPGAEILKRGGDGIKRESRALRKGAFGNPFEQPQGIEHEFEGKIFGRDGECRPRRTFPL